MLDMELAHPVVLGLDAAGDRSVIQAGTLRVPGESGNPGIGDCLRRREHGELAAAIQIGQFQLGKAAAEILFDEAGRQGSGQFRRLPEANPGTIRQQAGMQRGHG